jgi:hypothetical protein
VLIFKLIHCGWLKILSLAIGLCVANIGAAESDPIKQEGLVFSDELGGFRLLSVTGTGSIADPFVIVEEIAGDRAVALLITGLTRDFGNRVGTQHVVSFAMRKIVVNRSDRVWRHYQMELREVPTRRSPYEDGLSFGQNSELGLAYVASNFPDRQRFDEPEDTLGFGGATILPGERAEFSFIVSDMSPIFKIYLFQIPLQPLSWNEPENPSDLAFQP